jgi:hypothetical protein
MWLATMTGPTLHNAGSIGANIRDDDTSPGTSTIGMLFVFVTIGPPRVHLSLLERSVGARIPEKMDESYRPRQSMVRPPLFSHFSCESAACGFDACAGQDYVKPHDPK